MDGQGPRGRIIGRRIAPLLLAALLCAGVCATAAAAPASAGPAGGRWIVELAAGSGVERTDAGIRGALGLRPEHVFRHALHGFAAALTTTQRQRLLGDPRVVAVTPDRPIRSAFQPQQVQPGVERVGAPDNPDRDNPPLDVDIAIIDTGIQPDHPDLNVVGGYNCTDPGQSESARREPSSWRDGGFGHGTHVAGIAAARDNGQGVAGVAAGARLWSVRVLDHAGLGYWSWIICGLDWVAGRADPDAPGQPLFEVANMSLAGGGADDGDCGYSNADLLHRAVCRLERDGVTIVAAAGNNDADSRGYVPAAYDEVLAVSAMADYDGRAGGLADTPSGCATRDDGFASFSNFGPDVDLIAPGVCVLSTLPGSRYGRISGTSMAAAHVAGGAALFHLWEARHGRPRPDPQVVRAALQAVGTLDWRTTTDGDSGEPGSEREKALSVAALGGEPTFRIGATPAVRRVLAAGTATYDVWTAKTGGFDASVSLAVEGLPAGASWSVEADPYGGGTGWRRIVVQLPRSAAGSHKVAIQANGGGVARSAHVVLNVDAASSTSTGAPRLGLRSGVASAVIAVPARVEWPAVAGADAYELQVSRDGGAWTAVALSSPTRTSVARKVWPGSSYRHRLRVRDNGAWGPWLLSAASVAVPRYAPYDGVALSGAWAIAQKPGSYSELPAYSRQAGASARLEFVGRSVSWISIRGPKRGKARVYVDGALAATVDLYAASNRLRSVVFSRSWATAGAHSIEIVVRGTSGRPRVDVDAVVVVRDQ